MSEHREGVWPVASDVPFVPGVSLGLRSRAALLTPLQARRCTPIATAATHPVGSLFLYGALDSPPFFPSHVASGRCVLSAAAAGAPAGVVSAFAEPSSRRTGGCARCCGGRFTVFAAHSPPASGRPTPCLAVSRWACGPSGCCCFTGPWTLTRHSSPAPCENNSQRTESDGTNASCCSDRGVACARAPRQHTSSTATHH